MNAHKRTNDTSDKPTQFEGLLQLAETVAKFGNWQYLIDKRHFIYSNGAAKIYGFDHNEASMDFVKQLTLPYYRSLLDTAFSDLILRGVPYNVEYQIHRGVSGEIVDIVAVAEYDPANNRVYGTVIDITEYKRIEQALAYNEAKFHALFATMNEGAAFHTLLYNDKDEPVDYRIVEVNDAFEAQLGITKDAVINKSSCEAYGVGEPPFFDVYLEVALTGKPAVFERYFPPLKKYFSISVYCPYLGSFATIFDDITERIIAEQAQKVGKNQLRVLNATKDTFFSIIAHDLKSPLSGVLGLSELLKQELKTLDVATIEKYVNLIHDSAQQTFCLLENLLEWAKTQQQGMHAEPSHVVVNKLINKEMDGVRNAANQKGIALTFQSGTEETLYADEKMVSTIVRNLLSNAVKFTRSGGVVTVRTEVTADNFVLTVTDTGVGMDQATIDALFRIESSFSSRGTANEKGTGLGLLLCMEFIEKHGGSFHVSSKPGCGSTFTCLFPLDKDRSN